MGEESSISIKSPGTPTERKVLFLIVYSLDANHSVFSHQNEIAKRLGQKFEKVIIVSILPLPESNRFGTFLRLHSLNWDRAPKLISLIVFFYVFFSTLMRERSNLIIFSHMTDFFSALLAPFTKVFMVKHFLWYAHANKSIYLQICERLLDGILSSTVGSIPLGGPKVSIIGQGIDLGLFAFDTSRDYSKQTKLVAVGRIDESKGIRELIEDCIRLRKLGFETTITFIGQPSSTSDKYFEDLYTDFADHIRAKTVTFLGAKKRSELASTLMNYDVFVHAFQGSLDKSVLEAAAVGIPILSLNFEFQKFASDCLFHQINEPTIYQAYLSFRKVNRDCLVSKSKCLRLKVELEHSLERWVEKTMEVLESK